MDYVISKFGFFLHLGLGPAFGVVRQVSKLHLKGSESTFDGLEAFWDFGCSFLYVCLWILIILHPNAVNSKANKSRAFKSYAAKKNSSSLARKKTQWVAGS
jgi:hypothetical protein